MGRALAVFLALWTIALVSLVEDAWWSLTPLQRAYARPEFQAELLAPFVLHLPWGGEVGPRIAAVFVPPQGGPARKMSAPAWQVLAALRGLFSEPLLPRFGRIAAIAAAEAAVLYGLLLALARRIAARSRQQALPVTPGGP